LIRRSSESPPERRERIGAQVPKAAAPKHDLEAVGFKPNLIGASAIIS
jgi:hypothetical protein